MLIYADQSGYIGALAVAVILSGGASVSLSKNTNNQIFNLKNGKFDIISLLFTFLFIIVLSSIICYLFSQRN